MPVKFAGEAWTQELCRALGEDPAKVFRIEIVSQVGMAVTATITKYVDRNSGLLETIKKVAWKEVDDAK